MTKLADMNLFDLCMRQVEATVLPKVPKAAMLQAKRFVFDSSASQFVGELMHRAPLEVLSQHRFAKAPYPSTWIEMDHDAYYRLGLKHPENPHLGAKDARIGILVHNDHVTMFVSGENGHVSSIPFIYDLHRSVSFEEELETAQDFKTSRLMLRMWHLGEVSKNMQDDWWHSTEAADICRSHRMTVLPEVLELPQDKLQILLQSHTGGLKLILVMLLLLVRPHNTFVVHEVGHRRAIVKGKQQVLQDHHVIKLRLEHKDPVTRYLSHQSTGIHRRLHDVHGHWCQHRRKGSCTHDWREMDVDDYECVKCGAKRWWRKDHQRGKKQLGRVTKEYEVTR